MCGISAADDGGCGGALAKGAVDVALEGMERGRRVRLFGVVARDRDVDDTPRRDVRRKKDGGEFNLRKGELWVMAGDKYAELRCAAGRN